jgi:hypothetical protein
MVDVPLQLATYVTAPVAEFIVLPPVILAASRLYVIDELFVAVASYVTVPAPWQRVDVDPAVNTGLATAPLMVTVCVAVFGPPQPAALAVMVDVPTQSAI